MNEIDGEDNIAYSRLRKTQHRAKALETIMGEMVQLEFVNTAFISSRSTNLAQKQIE